MIYQAVLSLVRGEIDSGSAADLLLEDLKTFNTFSFPAKTAQSCGMYLEVVFFLNLHMDLDLHKNADSHEIQEMENIWQKWWNV